MTTILKVGVFTLLGALTVSDIAIADEPKKQDETHPERITVRVWDRQGKKFLDGVAVNARREDGKDGTVFWFISNRVIADYSKPTKGSEITDAKGNVYVSRNVLLADVETKAVTTQKPKP